jgi:hypothetical protein
MNNDHAYMTTHEINMLLLHKLKMLLQELT